MPIDKSKITKEMLVKAEQCKTADELIPWQKKQGWRLPKQKPKHT